MLKLAGATQLIHTAPRMSIHHAKRRIFFMQRTQHKHQHDVLEHIGDIAGMETMAVVQSLSGVTELRNIFIIAS